MSGSAPNSFHAQGVASKALQGAVALGIRQILVQGARILGGILLARLLTPAQFGVFAIILYLQTFVTAFGDAGLAASLIRQQEEPSGDDYRAVFTVQQLFVFCITAVLWTAAPRIGARYHLQAGDAWLFRLAALSFLITSFMVIPVTRLERSLAFRKIAIIEPAQAILFNGVAVVLAWRGFGSLSFGWALLARAVAGTAIANWIHPWKIGWKWDWQRVRTHMSFGLPYQGIQVASLLKDSISPVLIGLLLGTADVGYVTWAGMLAAYPVLALLALQRIYMPAFARLQHATAQLAAMTENVIWATNAVTAPLAVVTLTMVVPITRVIYGEKWLVAIPYFYLFWAANIFLPTATPALALLNALGRSRTAFMFAIIWMAGTWMIGAPLVWLYGPMGYAVANFVVQLSNLWLCRAAQKLVPFRVLPVAIPCWLIACAVGALEYAVCRLHSPLGLAAIAYYALGAGIVYSAGLYVFYKNKVQMVWMSLRGAR